MNDGLLPRWTGGGCVALVLRPLPLRLGSAGCCCAAGMLGCGVFQLMAVCLDLLGGCAACLLVLTLTHQRHFCFASLLHL